MTLMRGVTVTLYERAPTAVLDAFGVPVSNETAVTVDNVLIAPLSEEELRGQTPNDESGYRVMCQLAIPKGDTHNWENCRVTALGHDWRIIGTAKEGVEALIPGAWHKIFRAVRINADENNQN